MNWIRNFAHRPGDTDDLTFHKRLILIIALSCCLCGLIWSALYVKVFGIGLTMALPLVFVVVVGVTIVISARLGDHRPLVYAQLLCITWISALIEWSIGGVAASGLVIAWSFLGPIGALIFLPMRQAAAWMAMFMLIVAISVGLEPALPGAP